MNSLYPQIIGTIIRAVPQVIPHLSALTRLALKAVSYDGIRATYWIEIYDAVLGYLTGDQPITSFRNRAKTAAADAFVDAGEAGYTEGGAELPMDDETLAWLAERQAAEFGFIDSMFQKLRENWETLDAEREALARAEGYTRTLDGIYSEAKTRAAKNKMLTFGGDDGRESCAECKKYKGQRHRASWWVSHGLIPAPGNTNFTCQGYNCDHHLYDDDGNEWTE